MKNLGRTLKSLTKLPPVKWDRRVSSLSSTDQLELNRAVESDAQRLILLGEYLSSRSNGQDHAGAVKRANARVVKVRRAMGFTYPERGLVHF